LSPFNLPLRINILLPLQKSNNRAPCLFFPKSLFFLSLGISSKSRQLTPFSIKSENEKLLDFQKNNNQERINNLIIELSRPGDDMNPGSVNSIVENIGEIFIESAKITFGTFCSTKSRPRQKKSED
jgi:hypothetical protein